MASFKLIVQNSKVILKTMANYVLNITGIKDSLTGDGTITAGKINWTLQEFTNTASWFTTNNPILLVGQKGIETDDLLTTPKFKIGDGVTAWNSLPYASSSSQTLSQTLANGNTSGANDIIAEQEINMPNEQLGAMLYIDNLGNIKSTLIQSNNVELKSNKATTMTGNTTSNILFLSAKAIYDWATGLFELTSNKQNSLAVDGTGVKYVTVDAVNSGLATKQATLVSGTNIRTVNGSTLLGSTNLQVGTILGTLPATAGLIPFANGTLNTVKTNSNFNYTENTTVAGGILQLGGNAYVARTGLAMTMGSSQNYIVGDFLASGYVSHHFSTPTVNNGYLYAGSLVTALNSSTSVSMRLNNGSDLFTLNSLGLLSNVNHRFFAGVRSSNSANPLIIQPNAATPTADFNQGYIFNAGNVVNVPVFAGTYTTVRSNVHFGTTSLTAPSATTFTDYSSIHVLPPVASTNVTVTRLWSQYVEGNAYFKDKIYIGSTPVAPTAFLQIAPSTTSFASLRLGTGVAPASPNDGDIWFDGTDIKMRVGGVTKTFTLI